MLSGVVGIVGIVAVTLSSSSGVVTVRSDLTVVAAVRLSAVTSVGAMDETFGLVVDSS